MKSRLPAIVALFTFLVVSSGAAAGRFEDPAWMMFESGKRAFSEKRFGQALDAFRMAVSLRKNRFDRAIAELDKAIGKGPDAIKEDSLLKVLDEYAKKELLSFEYERLKKEAGDSVMALVSGLSKYTLSERFTLLLDALSAALDYRSIQRTGYTISGLRRELLLLARFPEAEYWIGRVFMLEGEYPIAIEQFSRAISMKDSYEIPEDVYLAMYSRAECLKYLNLSQYENALEEICATDPVYGSEENAGLRDSMLKVLSEKGFDAFLTLYRHGSGFALKAYDEYGTYLYERARPRAVLVLALATNVIATRMIERVRAVDPSYTYAWDRSVAASKPAASDGLVALFARIDRMSELSRYAEETGFYRLLYTLANALYANGSRSTAREIWSSLSLHPGAGLWARKASEQLKSPEFVPIR